MLTNRLNKLRIKIQWTIIAQSYKRLCQANWNDFPGTLNPLLSILGRYRIVDVSQEFASTLRIILRFFFILIYLRDENYRYYFYYD